MIRPAVPDVFIIAAHNVNLPSVCRADQAVGAAFELMNMSADAVYSAMSPHSLKINENEFDAFLKSIDGNA